MNPLIDVSKVKLYSERLVLRPFEKSDLDDFFEYASVDGVGQMVGWLPHKNKEETKVILDMFIEHKKTLAIVLNNKVIGSIGIERYSEERIPGLEKYKARELGFVLSKAYRGKGLMTEACKVVIEYLFNVEKLDLIVCCHFKENYQSKRVQEKCGFTYYLDNQYATRYNSIKDNVVNILFNSRYKEDENLCQ